MMTAKERVLSVCPQSHCWIVLAYPELWFVQPTEDYNRSEIGEGPTEEAAWLNAAENLNV